MSFGLLEIIVIVIFILIVLFFVWLLRGGDRQRMPVASDISQIDWSVFERDDVIQAISRGNKIEAIKIYRQCTDQGLAESKFAVEYAINHPEAVKSGKRRITSNIPSDAGIRDLIAEGRIDEAITIYQKFAGVDKFSARDAITELQQEIRLSDNAIPPSSPPLPDDESWRDDESQR